jgi:hypothetical protein
VHTWETGNGGRRQRIALLQTAGADGEGEAEEQGEERERERERERGSGADERDRCLRVKRSLESADVRGRKLCW